MKKILIIAICSLAVIGFAKQAVTLTEVAAGSTTATWTNDLSPKMNREVHSAYLLNGTAANDTVTATVTDGGDAYVVDTGTLTTNSVGAGIDFDKVVIVNYGDTLTFTRTDTNYTLNVQLVIE